MLSRDGQGDLPVVLLLKRTFTAMSRKQPAYPPERHATPDCDCTGKICSGCDQTKCLGFFHRFILSRDGYRSRCKTCRSVGETTTESNKARRRQLYHRDIEESRRKSKARRNAEKDKERRRIYRANNPDKIRAYEAEYNRSESRKQYIHQYRQKHPEITINHRNRQREAGKFTAQEWIELKTLYSYSCLCCGRQEPDINLTVDHVIPLVKGGANTIDNIQPLCITCNKKKGTKTTDYRQ